MNLRAIALALALATPSLADIKFTHSPRVTPERRLAIEAKINTIAAKFNDPLYGDHGPPSFDITVNTEITYPRLDGGYSPTNRTIYIRDWPSPIDEILYFHELVHAYDHSKGLTWDAQTREGRAFMLELRYTESIKERVPPTYYNALQSLKEKYITSNKRLNEPHPVTVDYLWHSLIQMRRGSMLLETYPELLKKQTLPLKK